MCDGGGFAIDLNSAQECPRRDCSDYFYMKVTGVFL